MIRLITIVVWILIPSIFCPNALAPRISSRLLVTAVSSKVMVFQRHIHISWTGGMQNAWRFLICLIRIKLRLSILHVPHVNILLVDASSTTISPSGLVGSSRKSVPLRVLNRLKTHRREIQTLRRFSSAETPDTATFQMVKTKIKSLSAQYSKRLARDLEDLTLL